MSEKTEFGYLTECINLLAISLAELKSITLGLEDRTPCWPPTFRNKSYDNVLSELSKVMDYIKAAKSEAFEDFNDRERHGMNI